MVIPFSSGHLTFLQNVQERTMQDSCVHEVRSTAVDSMNEPIESWADGSTFSAGLDMSASQEVAPDVRGVNSEAPVTRTDAQARLPMSAVPFVKEGDRLRFTHRFGQALATPLRFRVVGIPERGPSGLVVKLSRLGPEVEP